MERPAHQVPGDVCAAIQAQDGLNLRLPGRVARLEPSQDGAIDGQGLAVSGAERPVRRGGRAASTTRLGDRAGDGLDQCVVVEELGVLIRFV